MKPIKAIAEESDVEITAEKIEFDEKNNTIEYSNHVLTKKGNKSIKSDKLKIIRTQDGKIKKILAKGSPCKSNLNKEFMSIDEVESSTIEIFPEKNLIYFKKNVIVKKDGNILYTDELQCDMSEKKCKAISQLKNGTKLIIKDNNTHSKGKELS
jgi:lipopolysaccharide transport protein LptA